LPLWPLHTHYTFSRWRGLKLAPALANSRFCARTTLCKEKTGRPTLLAKRAGAPHVALKNFTWHKYQHSIKWG